MKQRNSEIELGAAMAYNCNLSNQLLAKTATINIIITIIISVHFKNTSPTNSDFIPYLPCSQLNGRVVLSDFTPD